MAEADSHTKLRRIKLVHTLAWAVFAGAILVLPFAILAGRLELSAWLSALVWAEIVVLVVNGMRCPLTAVAARHTDSRAANFDIFLPEWLARWNKLIFGTLFVADQLLLGWRWSGG